MGGAQSQTGATNAGEVPLDLDYEKVRAEILSIMDSPDWDDGSYAPILIRLAWHSSGTYSCCDGTGGSNAATMRFAKEANDPENAGLDKAREWLEQVKRKFPSLSYADLWVLAGYCAIEHTGGPCIPFQGGRVDAPESQAIAPGRLPQAEGGVPPGMETDSEGRIKGWEACAAHVRDIFTRMGFGDREIVALMCGGHVYGRCHDSSSGYMGAWVENPTRFSNEYAADLVGDKWILVSNDTKMPDNGEVPGEVRPIATKRQYIDLSKYEPEDDDDKKNLKAPDSKEFPPGKYVCVSDWVNCREQPDVGSPIMGRFNQGEELNLITVKVFGTAVRGLAERNGWVSIVGSAGKTLFERKGDLDTQAMAGKYRVIGAMPTYTDVSPSGEPKGENAMWGGQGEVFDVSNIVVNRNDEIFGKLPNQKFGLIFSPSKGMKAEKVVQGYNEKPRKAIKGQTGHQMMLLTDMVMLWDPEFNKVVQEYADDQELLSKDFGKAFKRLTELGCPWSADYKGGGCPLFCGK